MDGGVVLMVGLNGSLVVLVATGGNSPLAERKYNAFIEKAVLSFLHVQAMKSCCCYTEDLEELSCRPLTGTENVEPPAGVILSFVPPMAIHREWNA